MIKIIIILTYVLQHISSIFLLQKSTRLIFIGLSILAYLLIYTLKSDSYDIITYVDVYRSGNEVFEVGFRKLSNFLMSVSGDARTSVALIQILLAFLFIGSSWLITASLSIQSLFLNACLCFSSIAFTLGVNNNLRQAIASALILTAIYLSYRKHILTTILLLCISVFFHKSSIAFAALAVFFSVFVFFVYEKNYPIRIAHKLKLNARTTSGFIIFFGVLAIPILYSAMHMGFYDRFLSIELFQGRVGPIIKFISISIIFLLSEFLLGKMNKENTSFLDVLRFLRIGFMVLLFALCFDQRLHELFSRVMFFYFLVEMYMLPLLIKHNKTNALVSILIFYGFAINSWNILANT